MIFWGLYLGPQSKETTISSIFEGAMPLSGHLPHSDIAVDEPAATKDPQKQAFSGLQWLSYLLVVLKRGSQCGNAVACAARRTPLSKTHTFEFLSNSHRSCIKTNLNSEFESVIE